MTPREQTRQLLAKYEAVKLESYICPAGYRTLGIGHNVDSSPLTNFQRQVLGIPGGVADKDALITEEGAFWLLDQDIAEKERRMKAVNLIPTDVNPEAWEIVLRMCFQMGVSGVRGFPSMRKALTIIPPDYKWAAREMLDSKWARSDSPSRAEAEAARMKALA